MQQQIRRWEFFGAMVIIVLGSVFHFVYEWLGNWRPAALIFAVNESTWEHLKLAFWPAIIWSLIERVRWTKPGNDIANFFVAKAVALYIMPILIVGIFYSYTAILGDNFLILDISSFILAVCVGQYCSYRILSAKPLSATLRPIAMAAIIIITTCFLLFTFMTPRFFLFHDPVTGGYGIVN
jgi:hypothetical protein